MTQTKQANSGSNTKTKEHKVKNINTKITYLIGKSSRKKYKMSEVRKRKEEN